jgi:hypothetical protein
LPRHEERNRHGFYLPDLRVEPSQIVVLDLVANDKIGNVKRLRQFPNIFFPDPIRA